MDDGDDDAPRLPADTLAILEQFYSEKREQGLSSDSHRPFDEDWQLSQFWYDDETVQYLTKIVERTISDGQSVALISCPTLYGSIKQIHSNNLTVKLLEFDRRFEIHGSDYVYYDFNRPLDVSEEFFKSFDLVIADPPFLSDECLLKTCETIQFLARDKVILCTGTVMTELAKKLLNVNICKFKPKHKNNLGNEFSCFANFNIDIL